MLRAAGLLELKPEVGVSAQLTNNELIPVHDNNDLLLVSSVKR